MTNNIIANTDCTSLLFMTFGAIPLGGGNVGMVSSEAMLSKTDAREMFLAEVRNLYPTAGGTTLITPACLCTLHSRNIDMHKDAINIVGDKNFHMGCSPALARKPFPNLVNPKSVP